MASPILPDDLWKRLEPWIPKPKERRHVQFAGRKPTEPRRVRAGILFVLRTGIPWRWLPATNDFPCGQTCRRHLQQWQKAGVWQDIFESLLAELQATHKIDWYRALVDSASVRAPCGGAKTGPNPTDRRKLGSKHHLLTDANGIPLSIILTEANRHDVTQLIPLLDKIPHVKGKRGLRAFVPTTFKETVLMIPNLTARRSKKGGKAPPGQTSNRARQWLGQNALVYRTNAFLAPPVSKAESARGEIPIHA